MKPIVDDSCIACGTCEAIVADVFKIEEKDGKMIAIVQETDYGPHKDKINESIEACPVQAISLEK